MTIDELPLLELFNRLQEAGLPLGIDEYHLLLRSLQAGFGLPDRAALARLCCNLWVKSAEEKQIFDYHFEQVMHQPASSSTEVLPISNPEAEQRKIMPRLIRYGTLGSILVLTIGPVLVGLSLINYKPTSQLNPTPTATNTPSPTPTATNTPSPTPTATNTPSPTPTATNTPSPTPTATNTPSPTPTATNTPSPTPTATNTPSPTPTATNTPSPTPTATNTPSPTPTATNTPSPTPTATNTPSPTPTATNTPNPTPTATNTPNPNFTPIISDNFLLTLITLTIGSIMLISRIRRTRRRHRTDTSPTQPNQKGKINDLPAQLTKQIKDEIQIAQTLRQAISKEGFLLNTDYLPVTRRQMKQSWRYLRRLVREGPAVELDLEATVNEIGRQGLLLEPVFIPRRVNRTELVLLIDRDGSMVPFHSLSQRLTQTALQGSGLRQVKIYYFHNCPTGYLYHDPAHVEAEPISKIFPQLHSQRTSVLIFSDGGAACGRWNPERIQLTAEFLQQLRQQVRYLAWLNPMPRYRWRGTTAGEIARMLPMFEFNRRGLDQAIAVLRGKSNG